MLECLIESGSKQYKVKKDEYIYIDYSMRYKKEQLLVFDKVLYVINDGNFVLGKPYVKNARVEGVIEDVVKGKKLQWIKYGKSSFKVKKGYRHKYAKVKITDIKV